MASFKFKKGSSKKFRMGVVTMSRCTEKAYLRLYVPKNDKKKSGGRGSNFLLPLLQLLYQKMDY